MNVNKIQSTLITPKTTGYAATTSLGLAVLSGASKNKKFRNTHKPFAILTAILTALHIGLIEYYHHKYRSK